MRRYSLLAIVVLFAAFVFAAEPVTPSYKVLATTKTSTMEKELNQAGAAGYRFEGVMGGETAGGKEVVIIMAQREGEERSRYTYKLLATQKTSTMQRELDAAAKEGFVYRGQTVFETSFGGDEVVVILERDAEKPAAQLYEYKLLATLRTSTMEKEMRQAAEQGFEFVTLTLGKTAFGGNELVTILRRPARTTASR